MDKYSVIEAPGYPIKEDQKGRLLPHIAQINRRNTDFPYQEETVDK